MVSKLEDPGDFQGELEDARPGPLKKRKKYVPPDAVDLIELDDDDDDDDEPVPTPSEMMSSTAAINAAPPAPTAREQAAVISNPYHMMTDLETPTTAKVHVTFPANAAPPEPRAMAHPNTLCAPVTNSPYYQTKKLKVISSPITDRVQVTLPAAATAQTSNNMPMRILIEAKKQHQQRLQAIDDACEQEKHAAFQAIDQKCQMLKHKANHQFFQFQQALPALEHARQTKLAQVRQAKAAQAQAAQVQAAQAQALQAHALQVQAAAQRQAQAAALRQHLRAEHQPDQCSQCAKHMTVPRALCVGTGFLMRTRLTSKSPCSVKSQLCNDCYRFLPKEEKCKRCEDESDEDDFTTISRLAGKLAGRSVDSTTTSSSNKKKMASFMCTTCRSHDPFAGFERCQNKCGYLCPDHTGFLDCKVCENQTVCCADKECVEPCGSCGGTVCRVCRYRDNGCSCQWQVKRTSISK